MASSRVHANLGWVGEGGGGDPVIGTSGHRDIGTSGHRVKPTTEGQIHKDKYMETSPRIGKAKSASRGYSAAFYAKFTSPDLMAFPFLATKEPM